MVEARSIGQGGEDAERDLLGRQLGKDAGRDLTDSLFRPSGCIRGAESFLGSAAGVEKEAECRTLRAASGHFFSFAIIVIISGVVRQVVLPGRASG